MIARLALVLPVYLAIYLACFTLAYLLRFDFRLPPLEIQDLLRAAPWVLAIKIGWLMMTREWRRRHRYTTVADAKSLLTLALAGAGCLFIVNAELRLGIPRSVVLIDAFLNIVAVGGLRAALRLWNDVALPARSEKQRTLIYGCDTHAVSLLRSLDGGGSQYLVVGMIDPRSHAPASVIGGKRVFGADQLFKAARRLNARHLLIPASVPGQQVRELIHALHETDIKAHVIPAVGEIVQGRYKLAIRDVTIEDLLRRPPAQLDREQIRGYIEGKRVLVTGGAGSRLGAVPAGARPAARVAHAPGPVGVRRVCDGAGVRVGRRRGRGPALCGRRHPQPRGAGKAGAGASAAPGVPCRGV
jgi:FlaA1/EpsC-like NDP-sugar epimerase